MSAATLACATSNLSQDMYDGCECGPKCVKSHLSLDSVEMIVACGTAFCI